ncbi:unnamed protein product [Meganyctiphanes norvegica]|uniref:Ribosomal protein eL8/eL30/eS12/Gadd45 domain-containing protein n=1 Tax=Meganyctiphanes norvegica TaxID=48144 RepID=A0AAV2QA11_MEGNR
MLSPDVPEFIPKGMRGPESSKVTIAVVSNVPVESYSKNTFTDSKSIHNPKTHVRAHIKDNSKEDEPRKYSQYNTGRNAKSWQNRNLYSNLEQKTYTRVLKRNEPPKKSTVASRLFKEQYREELWPSLPGADVGQSVAKELNVDIKNEDTKNKARISNFPSHINDRRNNTSQEQSNIWQVRKSSNVQQNVSINKDYSRTSNDSKISNSHIITEEGKVPQTFPVSNKLKKINKKQILNKNFINESDKNENSRKSTPEIIVQEVHETESFPVQSVKDKQNNSEVTASSQVTNNVSVDLPDDNEEWQVQKDRKRRKNNTDKQKKPNAFGENLDNSNIQFRNRDGSYKGKDKEKRDGNLFQKNKSSDHKKKEVDNNSVGNEKSKTKVWSSKENNSQNAQYRNKNELNTKNDKFKGFEVKKKDFKDNRKEPSLKKYEVKTNVTNEKSLKSRKTATQQINSPKDNLNSNKEQDKCENMKEKDNTMSKQMSSEEFEKFKAERKLKRKEEKIRKRELRLRKEMAMSRGDSKVMVITREFLEAMTSKSSLSSHTKKEEKAMYTDIDHDYPSLDVGEGWPSNELNTMTNKLKEVKVIDTKCEKNVEVKRGNNSEETERGSIANEPIFSYSTALVTSKKKKVNNSTIKEKKEKTTNKPKAIEKDPPKPCETAVPQKKLKMKDRIEFDLMAAIGARSTKQKKKTSDLKQVSLGNLVTKNKGVVALGSKIRSVTSAAQPKRGKQREDQKRKKKLSVLKKRMKENQGIDGECLVDLLMQAKQFREEENITEIISHGHSVDSSKEPIMEHTKCSDDTDFVPCNSSSMQSVIKISETNNLDKREETKDMSQGKVCELNLNSLVDCDNKCQQPEEMNDSVKPTEAVFPSISETVSSQHPLQKFSQEVSEKCQELVKEIIELQDPIHKNSFREYCNHVLTPELDSKAQALIEALVRFQERQYLKDPVKARIRRRYVCGLKEAIKLMGKMSCILVAPDITRSKGPGALDERVEQVLSRARESAVPVIFVLSKRKLGKISRKKGTVSCFGIINYQGAQDFFNEMMELVPAAKQQYEQLVAQGRLTRPIPGNDNVSDDEEDNSVDVGEERNDINLTDGNPKEIMDINKKIIDSLTING